MKKKYIRSIIFLFLIVLYSSICNSVSCNYGKGYSEHFIKLMIGKRQNGQIKNWVNNINVSQVRKGDVAIFRSINHAAYVHSVVKNKYGRIKYIIVKEWNYGTKWFDYTCNVTNKFGKTTKRRVKLEEVDGGFWRP